ncbi:MAG: hypothetical protein L6Q38_04840, partial [Nitrospira sp.]|nr:hypothetical protein [Nitrospira sp.]
MSHALDAGSPLLHEAGALLPADLLAEQRQAIQQRLLAGASGDEVVNATTDLVDGLIIGRYRTAARAGGEGLTTVGFHHC